MINNNNKIEADLSFEYMYFNDVAFYPWVICQFDEKYIVLYDTLTKRIFSIYRQLSKTEWNRITQKFHEMNLTLHVGEKLITNKLIPGSVPLIPNGFPYDILSIDICLGKILSISDVGYLAPYACETPLYVDETNLSELFVQNVTKFINDIASYKHNQLNIQFTVVNTTGLKVVQRVLENMSCRLSISLSLSIPMSLYRSTRKLDEVMGSNIQIKVTHLLKDRNISSCIKQILDSIGDPRVRLVTLYFTIDNYKTYLAELEKFLGNLRLYFDKLLLLPLIPTLGTSNVKNYIERIKSVFQLT